MKIVYPHTIENCIGEKIIFHSLHKEADGDRLIVENFVAPGIGPVMHTHWLQDEVLTVVRGRIGYEIMGQAKMYAGPGETVAFKKGTPHRFWNDGDEILHCTGYIKPAYSVVYFLSSIFAAQNKSGQAKPEMFDAAYLITRYSSEYDMNGMPGFVKKVIFPITYHLGKILGKYKHFKDAPEPVRA